MDFGVLGTDCRRSLARFGLIGAGILGIDGEAGKKRGSHGVARSGDDGS